MSASLLFTEQSYEGAMNRAVEKLGLPYPSVHASKVRQKSVSLATNKHLLKGCPVS